MSLNGLPFSGREPDSLAAALKKHKVVLTSQPRNQLRHIIGSGEEADTL